MSPNTRGALFMMTSMAAFTLNDTCIKVVGEGLPLFQLLVLRGSMATALVFVLAWRLGLLDFRIPRTDWGLIAIRTAAEVVATYFFLTALMNMPLANVTALLQVLPLTVTLGAALFFGERVGWRRITAILAGFLGMLLIVRPGPEGFNTFALYALVAVACVTLRDLITRRMSPGVSSMTITFCSSAGVLVVFAIGSLGVEWVPVSPRYWMLLVASSVFVIGGYLFSILVMRVGDVSFVAPFRYTGLLWALVLGWLVFDHWPAPLTLVGAAVVVASGLFTFYREQALPRG